MTFFSFRQLRWKIIAGHMLVVIVGVMVLSLAGEFLVLRKLPFELQPYLDALSRADTPAAIETTTTDLLATFYRDAVFRALLVAAISAILVGLLTSLFLAREILRPLWQLAYSSRRIADGHYKERVAVPASTELAVVATNFNQMAEALEHVERERVGLIGNVSHELRTPLTGIEGYLEGMMDGVIPSNTETFAHMYQEVRRLRRLVDDLQALSRIEAGQVALRLDDFDLIPLIKRVVNQLEPQAEVQALQVAVDLPPSIMVHADADRTAQVMLNLVGNAIRYTPEGGRIIVRAAGQARTAQVTVEDTGIGIPAEALPYIFERFYRVDPSRARSSGGSGIGLTISRHLVWAMGGDLSFTSSGLGQGSTFFFTLPLATNGR